MIYDDSQAAADSNGWAMMTESLFWHEKVYLLQFEQLLIVVLFWKAFLIDRTFYYRVVKSVLCSKDVGD